MYTSGSPRSGRGAVAGGAVAGGQAGLTVGQDRLLPDADLGDIMGGSQGAIHHCVSVFHLGWVCSAHLSILVSSVELWRVMCLGGPEEQKRQHFGLPRAAPQAAEDINAKALQEDPRATPQKLLA